MNELNFAIISSFGAFMAWEMLCYTQIKITKKRNKNLHKRIHGE